MASEDDIVFQLGVSGSDTVISALDKVDSKMKDLASRKVFKGHIEEIKKFQDKLSNINLSTWAGRTGFSKILDDVKTIRKELEIINGITSKGFSIRPPDYLPSKASKLANAQGNQNTINSFIEDRNARRRTFLNDFLRLNNAPLLLGDGTWNGPTGFTEGQEDYQPSASSRRAQFRRNANERTNWRREHPAAEDVIDMDLNGSSARPRRARTDEFGNPITGSGIRWNRSLVPFGANEGPSWNISSGGKSGFFGKLFSGASKAGGLGGGLMAAMSAHPIGAAIALLLVGLVSAVKLFKKITQAISAMNTAWKVQVTSRYSGSSSSDVQGLGAALMPYGGNYESAAGILRRFRTNMQNMRISGEGGGALEAASVRYGLNILGTEQGGLARPEQLLGRIARLMETLTNDQKVGLADTLGLDKATYELLAHGEENYNKKINKQTFLGKLEGYKGAYSKEVLETSRIGNEAWNEFLIVLKETGGLILEAIVPAFTVLIDALGFLLKIINVILKPITVLLGFIGKVVSARYWESASEMANSYGNSDSDNPTNKNVAYTITITNKMDVNAPSANSEKVADEVNKNIVSTLTSAIKANDNGIRG